MTLEIPPEVQIYDMVDGEIDRRESVLKDLKSIDELVGKVSEYAKVDFNSICDWGISRTDIN